MFCHHAGFSLNFPLNGTHTRGFGVHRSFSIHWPSRRTKREPQSHVLRPCFIRLGCGGSVCGGKYGRQPPSAQHLDSTHPAHPACPVSLPPGPPRDHSWSAHRGSGGLSPLLIIYLAQAHLWTAGRPAVIQEIEGGMKNTRNHKETVGKYTRQTDQSLNN